MHMRLVRAAVCVAIAAFLSAVLCSAQTSSGDKDEPFSTDVAERLMRQVRDGLVAQNPDMLLGAFDRDNMRNYEAFAGQVTAFFATWENIRVLYKITQADPSTCATECGTATVQFDMEAENVQSDLPPMRRGAQLRVAFQRGSKGWKIVNLTPRDLFR